MGNPFLLDKPAVISFSGGRTSGLMLRRIIDAFGGSLPPDVVPVFCNTGKERPETLDFVERVSLEWGVEIVWLEYRWEPGRHYFVQVNYATASRNGEPFDDLIKARSMLPNLMYRFCTVEMKIMTSHRFVKSLGWSEYTNAIGIRYDEPRRHAKLEKDNGHRHKGEEVVHPLFDARVTLEDVTGFWAAQPFDLALSPHEGNCDLCFLKGRHKIDMILRSNPELAVWWIAHEAAAVGKTKSPGTERFRARVGVRQMLAESREPRLFDDEEDVPDCRCTD